MSTHSKGCRCAGCKQSNYTGNRDVLFTGTSLTPGKHNNHPGWKKFLSRDLNDTFEDPAIQLRIAQVFVNYGLGELTVTPEGAAFGYKFLVEQSATDSEANPNGFLNALAEAIAPGVTSSLYQNAQAKTEAPSNVLLVKADNPLIDNFGGSDSFIDDSNSVQPDEQAVNSVADDSTDNTDTSHKTTPAFDLGSLLNHVVDAAGAIVPAIVGKSNPAAPKSGKNGQPTPGAPTSGKPATIIGLSYVQIALLAVGLVLVGTFIYLRNKKA